MQKTKGFILILFLFASLSGECNGFNWYHTIDKNDCNPGDISVLQKFIDNSADSLEMEMDINFDGKIQALELGWQLWEDGRLIHWICQDVPSPYYFYEYNCDLRTASYIYSLKRLEDAYLSRGLHSL